MNQSDKKILLLGYGEMGHTMENLLSVQHQVSIWDPYYKGELAEIDLGPTARSADVIIFCTPTVAIHALARQIAPHITSSCICLSMAKSLDETGRIAPEALQQGLPAASPYGLLYGPMISEEIIAGKPGFAMLATAFPHVANTTMSLFEPTLLKLKLIDDVVGAAWCAVLKNVYALLFGMADELGLGDNMRGYLAVETLAEMADILTLKQGQRWTPYTLAGLGDLITTATSEDSHHHELGKQLARNDRSQIHGEGVNSLNSIVKLKLLNTQDRPFFHLVEQVVLQNENPREFLNKLSG